MFNFSGCMIAFEILGFKALNNFKNKWKQKIF